MYFTIVISNLLGNNPKMKTFKKAYRKTIKKDYRAISKRASVFILKNNINHKVYIGSSVDLKKPGHRLLWELDRGSHPNWKLQEDWNKLGKENFSFEVLEEMEDKGKSLDDLKEELILLEKMCIEKMGFSKAQLYNRRTLVK